MGVQIFLDLNETFIQTGELSFEEREWEVSQHQRFVENCKKLIEIHGDMQVVFLTGNSFEYSRRIEEPLGLKNLPNLDLTIVSENGLIARSFKNGLIWKHTVSEYYTEAVTGFLQTLEKSDLQGKYYLQGNEIRTTVKPTSNRFSEEELEHLKKLSATLGKLAKVYLHPYYFDIDPKTVLIDGSGKPFQGKAYAVSRLVDRSSAVLCAFGDSESDIPAFEEIEKFGGHAYFVGNTPEPVQRKFPQARILQGKFAESINLAIESSLYI